MRRYLLASAFTMVHFVVSVSLALDETEFAKLHRALQPPPEEGWSTIPWKTSLVQACVQAANEKKPLFMVCRAGHPLGCV